MLYITLQYIDDTFVETFVQKYVSGAPFMGADFKTSRPSQWELRTASLALLRYIYFRSKNCSLQEARQLEVSRHSTGQPYIVGNDQPISISHSGRWIACCLSDGESPVGIDIEALNKPRNFQAIARHTFFEDEVAAVEAQGEIAFYKLWGAKEAIAKCQGQGLSLALSLNVESVLQENTVHSGAKVFHCLQKRWKGVYFTLAQQNEPLKGISFF